MTSPTAVPAPPAALDEQAHAAPDRIFLRDHIVEAEIGAFQAERGTRQRVRFSLIADLVPALRAAVSPHGPRDDVDTILSYDVLLDAIRDEMAGRRINLLETLAEGIAGRVLAHGGVTQVQVSIEKLDRVPGALGIDITRRRARAALVAPGEGRSAAPARLAVVAGAALAAPWLPGRIAALAAEGPLILCVDAMGADAGMLPPAVQRRIDLLAFEQAAWRLAARDPGFVVVDSRTELDWGLRNDQVSVWAPSKMVVDAREDAPAGPVCMAALVPWFARRMGIGQIVTLGAVALRDAADLRVSADG